MGPPGAGKGTQAARIAGKAGIGWVSTGDLFREHQKNNTELGRRAKYYMDRGGYVPDDDVIEMIRDWITAPERARGFILDGFPRTLAQAEALDRLLEDGRTIDRVLYLDVSPQVMKDRLNARRVCRSCRATYRMDSSPQVTAGKCETCGGGLYQREDDKPEVIERRIQVYAGETEPLVDYYRRSGKLTQVDGDGSIEKVWEKVWKELAAGVGARTTQPRAS